MIKSYSISIIAKTKDQLEEARQKMEKALQALVGQELPDNPLVIVKEIPE